MVLNFDSMPCVNEKIKTYSHVILIINTKSMYWHPRAPKLCVLA